MPLPEPTKNEDKDDFMSRCMSSDTMQDEYPTQQQRWAVCRKQWFKED